MINFFLNLFYKKQVVRIEASTAPVIDQEEIKGLLRKILQSDLRIRKSLQS